MENNCTKFNTLLEKIFIEIKNGGKKNLIVDIRNNEGGDDTRMTTTSYFKAIPADKVQGYPILWAIRSLTLST